MLRIKSVENKDIDILSELCCKTLLGTKIMCQLTAYGIERDFLKAWCCLGDGDEIQGVICKLEGSITMDLFGDTDSEDIRTFLDMIGFDSLCCSAETARKLNYSDTTDKKAYVYDGIYNGETIGCITEEYYRGCYSLICKSIPDSFTDTKEAYMYFLSDFTYRQRRNLARIKGFAENGKAYSCALTAAETDFGAIISGVACDEANRKSGFGKKTVLTLAEELKNEGKAVYVIALNESAEGFYEHIGFKFKEIISFVERK